MFVADGRKTSTYGSGRLSVKIGTQDVNISVLVADIGDSAILGMEFLSDVDGKIDLVQQQLVMDGEEIRLTCVVRVINNSVSNVLPGVLLQ